MSGSTPGCKNKRNFCSPRHVAQHLGGVAKKFGADPSGNIAIMFAVTLTMLLGFAGAGVDYTRSMGAQATLQEAADAGLLAAARFKSINPDATPEQLEMTARRVFDTQAAGQTGVNFGDFNVSFDPATNLFSVSVEAVLPTLLLRAAGRPEINVGVGSAAVLSDPPKLEIAMALDNTGSMGSNGRIAALRVAATDLVTTLLDAGGSDVQFSLVPFAQYVNVGTSRAGAPWLDAPVTDFSGCVGSRPNPLNERDEGYNTVAIPGLVDAATIDASTGAPGCPQEIIPLTSSKKTLTDAIKTMQPDGFTYIPAGLAWGWRVLSEGAPFTEGAPDSDVDDGDVIKYLVLMTDGANTRAPDVPKATHNSGFVSIANQVTEDLCTEVKDNNIVIFTVAFEVNNQSIKKILEECATAPRNAFTPDNPDELKRDFLEIANAVRVISLSR